MRQTYGERYDGMQIKIERKMLKSGKCQVKFRTDGLLEKDFYGYALVSADKSLREVVSEIKRKVINACDLERYYQENLYSIKRDRLQEKDFVIFKS